MDQQQWEPVAFVAIAQARAVDFEEAVRRRSAHLAHGARVSHSEKIFG